MESNWFTSAMTECWCGEGIGNEKRREQREKKRIKREENKERRE
jgi:hypothetical protein